MVLGIDTSSLINTYNSSNVKSKITEFSESTSKYFLCPI